MLDALSRQDGWHLRMTQLARAAALSSSAATRLVNRLEDRGLLTRILCADDRRGIYTELTAAGSTLLDEARPTHHQVLEEARSEHPNIRLVEWATLVGENRDLLAGDLVHGTPEGYARRAEETARAIRDCPAA